jgi:glutamate-ammonia-ligase adenylyltransferase
MKIIDPLPDILVQDLESKWEALEQSCAQHKINLPQDPQILQVLQRVLAFSDFVAENCIRHPALISDLIERGDLRRSYSQQHFSDTLKTVLINVKNEAALIQNLRVFRRREMTRIAFRDLAGWSNLAETVTDLTNLADTCLEQTALILYDWLSEKFGAPTAEDGSPQSLVILGLGKLGARELNFSSDIDLIFTYPKAGHTRGTPQSISTDDFFTRLGRQLIKVISQPTAEGFVFRMDMRLRPYGENGPLVMHFDALENYFEQQGREWERYALIRARIVAGDKKSGDYLLERLNPFIYRRYLDYGAYDSLREMKQMISLEVKRKGMKHNIKLGRGGIREIEFFGHMFQLIRGGVTPDLQQRSIQKVLKILARDNHIPSEVSDELMAAYVFLRNTEHRLQEFTDQQTHDLPMNDLDQARLAASMGFTDTIKFLSQLDQHRNNVHCHFKILLEAKDSESKQPNLEEQLQGIWQGLIGDNPAEEILASVGFEKPREVLQLLDYLRNSIGSNRLGDKGRRRLEKLIPQVLIEVGGDLIQLAGASPWIASFLAQHPVLLDELLDPRTLYIPPEAEQIAFSRK